MTATAARDAGDTPGAGASGAGAPGEGQPHALIERQGHVLIVTMNRPEARNALSAPMLALMRRAWDMADGDPGIR